MAPSPNFNIGLFNLVRKTIGVVTNTTSHVHNIPEGTSPRELELRSREWARSLVKTLGLEIHLHGDLPPLVGAKLIVSNHRSFADIVVINSLIPTRFLAKEEVKDWPVIGFAAKSVNTLFVTRERKSSREAVRHAIASSLEEGLTVTVFPEGTTSNPPGCLPFYKGAFEVAAKVGRPIVPIAIEYPLGVPWVEENVAWNFVKNYRKDKIKVFVTIGPTVYPNQVEDPEDFIKEGARLKKITESWIDQTLVETYEQLIIQQEPQYAPLAKVKKNRIII